MWGGGAGVRVCVRVCECVCKSGGAQLDLQSYDPEIWHVLISHGLNDRLDCDQKC
jgi:hypothetical protein